MNKLAAAFSSTVGVSTGILLILTALIAPIISVSPAHAQTDGACSEGAFVTGDFASAVVMDAQTKETLFANSARLPREPASMVKMMTELIVLEHIADGQLALTDSVEISGHSSKTGGSQVYLKEGERFTVEDLLMALAIHSANDAAVALAEHVAGSTEAFVELMNSRAQELQLLDTTFRSVHGLPPGRGQLPDMTTACDMATLGSTLIQHPEAARWGSTAEAPFRNGTFTLHNPNGLVGKFRGLEGIKTGYHEEAGYCVTASAMRQGRRIIAVVMGASSNKARAAEASRLLTLAFNLYTDVKLVSRENQPLDQQQRVKGGKVKMVSLAYAKPFTVSVRRDQAKSVQLEKQLPEKISAPILAGQEIGKAVAVLDGQVIGEVSIIAMEAVPRGNIFQQIFS
jgi:D-alanyl-D-alanine carboxypeptidase (penicillin-binding protein 5/6)